VFQITCKDRGSMRNFEGSIDVDIFKSSQVDHLFCRVMLQTLSGFWPETPLLSGTLNTLVVLQIRCLLPEVRPQFSLCNDLKRDQWRYTSRSREEVTCKCLVKENNKKRAIFSKFSLVFTPPLPPVFTLDHCLTQGSYPFQKQFSGTFSRLGYTEDFFQASQMHNN